MKFQTYLIKYGEIGIKGKNRYMFEDALVRQIRHSLKDLDGLFHTYKAQGRVYVDCDGDYDGDEVVEALKRVFGIVGICPVVRVEDKGFEELKKDYVSGVTFSGGEPTLQAKALIPLFQRLKEQNIHICIDTNGSIWNEEVEELLKWTDLVLLDIKEFNNVRHRQLTERSNEQTIRTAEWLEKNGKPFWLRYVLVPGYSSFEEDIRALGEHFKNYHMIQRVEILPYHTLGIHKYEAMGKEYKLNGIKENTLEQLETAKTLFGEYFNTVYLN